MTNNKVLYYTRVELEKFPVNLLHLCYKNWIGKGDFITSTEMISRLTNRVYRVNNNIISKGDVVIDNRCIVYRIDGIRNNRDSGDMPVVTLIRLHDGRMLSASRMLKKIPAFIFHEQVDPVLKSILTKIGEGPNNYYIIDEIMYHVGEIFIINDTMAQSFINAKKQEHYNEDWSPLQNNEYEWERDVIRSTDFFRERGMRRTYGREYAC